MFVMELRGICVVDCGILCYRYDKIELFFIGLLYMLPNNKLFVVWILDGLGLCEDVIRWEILELLVDWEGVFVKKFGENWREKFDDCFIWCCASGHLNVVKWLWDDCSKNKLNESTDIRTGSEYALRASCYGHLNIAKWLWEVCNCTIDSYFGNDTSFRWNCKKGRLNVIKWLWEISGESIDRDVINEMIVNEETDKPVVDYLKSIV